MIIFQIPLASIALIVLLNVSCSVDTRQVPLDPEPTGGPTLCQIPLLLGDVQLVSYDSRHDVKAWKLHLLSAMKNRRLFSRTGSLEEAKSNKGPYLILDLVLRPTFKDDYNWWWTWPAVYPSSGYWPVQWRLGNYDVSIEYRILDSNQRLLVEDTVEVQGEESVIIYGFFRTSPFERMIYRSNKEIVFKWVQSLEGSIRSKGLCEAATRER